MTDERTNGGAMKRPYFDFVSYENTIWWLSLLGQHQIE